MCACQISLYILWKNPIAAHMIDVLHGPIFLVINGEKVMAARNS